LAITDHAICDEGAAGSRTILCRPKKTMVKRLTLIILDMCREFSLAVVAFKNNLWGAFSLAASFLVSECGIWQEQVYGMAAGYLLFLSPNKWVLDPESLLTLISFDRSLPPLWPKSTV
jgi:hypothetical protein